MLFVSGNGQTPGSLKLFSGSKRSLGMGKIISSKDDYQEKKIKKEDLKEGRG